MVLFQGILCQQSVIISDVGLLSICIYVVLYGDDHLIRIFMGFWCWLIELLNSLDRKCFNRFLVAFGYIKMF